MLNPLLVPELRDYLRTNDVEGIREFCRFCHPASIAEFISPLAPEEIWKILSLADPEIRPEIFAHLDPEVQMKVTDVIPRQELASLITDLPPDDRVDLIKRMPEERREMLMRLLAHAEREDIRRLSSYEEGTAGAVMTSDYAALPPNITVAEAIQKLRLEAPDKETIYYAYVVDANRRLLGFVSLKDLILALSHQTVSDIMHRDAIFCRVTDDQEEAARIIQKYDLLALPVVNEQGQLVGIITHDDAMDIITQEQTEDIEKLMAIGGAHLAGAYLRTSVWSHFKNRAVWIVALAALGLVSGMIIHRFEDTLTHMLILALYMPMVADTGGNTGSQSATVVVRALALREINLRDTLRVLWKEFRIAILLALVLGVLSWAKVMFLSQGAEIPPGYSLGGIAFCIAFALSLQVVSSALVGSGLPLLATVFKFDPAVVASPALTTIVDITGLFIYFNTARWILGL
ncbi:magnesium transporter [Thermopirellula anaerolimosa]